ncbi:MAG: rhomboid family intramembrane serine protease [Ignavibacteria bacterium]|nr:MAG: rhomboid family intramembrane serine protease [Ignavibacteria bacterium]
MAYYRYTNSNYYRPSFFGGFKYFPPVIKALLVSNTAVYLVTGLFGAFRLQGAQMADIINQYFPLYPLGGGFQVWQLFTYLFMHANFIHLLFNMFALWMFGMELENDWGSRKFLSYYLICGLGAGLSNLFIGPLLGPVGPPTVGASGAIFGVLIAFGVIYPDRPIFLYFLLPIRARYFIMFYIFMELYYELTGSAAGVAHLAHLGGAAVGFVYLMIDQRRIPFQRIISRARQRIVPSEKVEEYSSYDPRRAVDAKYSDVPDPEDHVDQQRIDEILDKISQHGYQSLTESEKKILFDASKKLN